MKVKHLAKKHTIFLGVILFYLLASLSLTLGALQKGKADFQGQTLAAEPLDSTYFAFTVYLPGIGNGGDSLNPTNTKFNNKNPYSYQRTLNIYVFSLSNQLILTRDMRLNYNEEKGAYTGTLDIGNELPPGDYIVKITTNSYLQKRIPETVHVAPLTRITMPPVTLVAGDLDGNNVINALDYNTLMGCYSDIILPGTFCDEKKRAIADLSGDDKVNQQDYNLLMREMRVGQGD